MLIFAAPFLLIQAAWILSVSITAALALFPKTRRASLLTIFVSTGAAQPGSLGAILGLWIGPMLARSLDPLAIEFACAGLGVVIGGLATYWLTKRGAPAAARPDLERPG